ncbi:MAG: DUF1592 domain-containing protein [Nannocystaceae bacterium]|nr:DUF1592 domain-containing protein [Nannocystaceae bacterium]
MIVQHVRGPIASAILTLLAGCYSGLDGRASGDDAASAGTGEGGSATEATAGDSGGGDDGVAVDFEPPPVRLRLLLARQYTHAIRDLLGDAAAAAATPPTDAAINGFDAVAASQLALTDAKVQAYEASARTVSELADAGKLAGHHTCVATGPADEACLREFVASFGRLAFRRTLTAVEIDDYTAAGLAAAAVYDDFEYGKRDVVATMLQSPNFLYQVEVGEPADTGGMRRLTSLELATRLSFYLRDTTPDAELLDLAEADGLADAAAVREVAAAMLETEEAHQALSDFASEVYRLRELPTTPKDPTVFPAFTPSLAAAMASETLAVLGEIVWTQDGDVRDLFDTDYTFVNAELAALYQLPNPEQYGEGFTKVTLPPEQLRGGLLGQAGMLSLLGHVTTTSPTYRGKFVRQQLLCQTIPAPPVNVDTQLPEGAEWRTMREKLEAHMSDPGCAGCHKMMDPIGLGLENYDGIGQFRTTENGATIDASADLDGTTFAGAKQLGAALKQHPDLPPCLMHNLFRHATGHIEVPGEASELDELVVAFEDGGYNLKSLMVEMVASPAFRMVGDAE